MPGFAEVCASKGLTLTQVKLKTLKKCPDQQVFLFGENSGLGRKGKVFPGPLPTINPEQSGKQSEDSTLAGISAEIRSEEETMEKLQKRFNFAEVWESASTAPFNKQSHKSTDFITVDIH